MWHSHRSRLATLAVLATISWQLATVDPAPAAVASFANPAFIDVMDVAGTSPYPSAITVSGLSGAITRVTVTLSGVSHGFAEDLDILLVGPGGQTLLLMSDVGGNSAIGNVTLTFDDTATTSLTVGPVGSGTFKPTNLDDTFTGGSNDVFPVPAPAGPFGSTLSVFNGTAPNGVWQLFVRDDALGEPGSIAGGWSLTITTTPDSPPPPPPPPAQVTLTVTRTGSGSGTVSGPGINCGGDCSESYGGGATVTLTAQPAAGSVFLGWSGGGCAATGPCTVTLPGNTTVTATFGTQLNNQFFTLTVTNAGNGSGTVTSGPAGVVCGADCSETYVSETPVTLTATPAAGSGFVGFGGDADCADGIVAMTADRSCTATFAGPTALVAAVLPASRSVQVGTTATAFASIINVGAETATGCGLAPLTGLPVSFIFQTTDPATNQVTGTLNAPVNVPPGATQSFVFALTPTAPIAPIEAELSFDCVNSDPAPIIPGLDTLLFSASLTPIPDIVALAATLNNDGIVNIPGAAGTGVFSVATVNLGIGDAITVSADTRSASLPVTISICQTDPTTGVCLAPPASTVTTQIDANATPTFGVFVTGSGVVPFDPATNRIFVRFTDAGAVTRGATSVAVRTQ